MPAILIILYSVWAVYSGFRVLSGRSEWLDRSAPLCLICKIILSLIVGYFIGVFFLIYLILKLFGFVSRM